MLDKQEPNTQILKPSVAVMMSGGVDSSVTAALLMEQGYRVEGFTLQTCLPEDASDERVYMAVRDARKVCDHLGIPHHIVDVTKTFRREIIARFEAEYIAGLTPNPCVWCNPLIKWGMLWEAARTLGMERVATGHYVRLSVDEQGVPHLRQGLDPNKDQSYFLWGLPADLLKITLFPLGEWVKPDTRAKAVALGIPVAEKVDSQEVCFLFNDDYRGWLLRRDAELAGGKLAGTMVDVHTGKKLGDHSGYPLFTIGQRKGLGLGGGRLMFVTGIDPESKRVMIGDREDLLSNSFKIHRMNRFHSGDLTNRAGLTVKVRYHCKAVPAVVMDDLGDSAVVRTLEPVESVTPGQAAVFYSGDEVVAGGIILR